MLVVGLTGDVGAGKSTIAKAWMKLGAFLIDSDEVVRSLWSTARMRGEAFSRFGQKAIRADDGSVDLSAIADAVFSREEDYRWVCGLLHPLALEKIERMLDERHGWVVVELPLLFEAGRPSWLDIVFYVTAPEEARMERTRARGWSAEELKRRERWLLPSAHKAALADIVFRNDEPLECSLSKIEKMGKKMGEIAQMAGSFPAPGNEGRRLLLEAILK
ncbi:MAG: dephospho-CoA kinase [Synergistales bacterium]